MAKNDTAVMVYLFQILACKERALPDPFVSVRRGRGWRMSWYGQEHGRASPPDEGFESSHVQAAFSIMSV